VVVTREVKYEGLRWKHSSPEEHAAAKERLAAAPERKLAPTPADLPAAKAFADQRATVQAFMRAFVDVVPAAQRTGKSVPTVLAVAVDKPDQLTFRRELEDFCRVHDRAVPTNLAVLYEITQNEVTVRKSQARIVFGVRLRDDGRVRVSPGRILVEFLTTTVHFFVLFMPSLLPFLAVMYSQEVYAQTTATRDPLVWKDFLAPYWLSAVLLGSGPQVVSTLRAVTAELIVYTTVMLAYVVVYYLDLHLVVEDSRLARMASGLLATVLRLHVAFILFLSALVLTWCLLAAILNPQRFLPVGVAIIVTAAVVIATRRQMLGAARKLRQALVSSFEARLQTALKVAVDMTLDDRKRKKEREVRKLGIGAAAGTNLLSLDAEPEVAAGDVATGDRPPQAAPAPGADKEDPKASAARRAADKAADKAALEPADVYAIIAGPENADSGINMEEFEGLFEKLDLGLSHARREQLFAYMDISGNGKIDQKEFTEGWEFLTKLLVDEAVDQAGVSEGQITVIVVGLLLWLAFLFAFIFVALQGWFAYGGFESAVQSMMISTAGFATMRMRRRSPAEDPDEFDRLVKGSTSQMAPART